MCIFFFFSSRRRHTRCSRDWSSDVCSSDLIRSWVSYNNISPHLRNAVLIAEDSAFFQHPGYDLEQIKESAKRNWREKRFARGASTITEQLAKNLYLSTSKNPRAKSVSSLSREKSKNTYPNNGSLKSISTSSNGAIRSTASGRPRGRISENHPPSCCRKKPRSWRR